MDVHLVLAAGNQASSMCQIIVLVPGVSSKGEKGHTCWEDSRMFYPIHFNIFQTMWLLGIESRVSAC